MSENYQIPDTNGQLKEILAIDTCEDLADIYRQIRKTVHGKTISDISLVSDELREWINIESAELLIPFTFGKKREEPFGHRIWYASRPKGEKYYFGQFFDLMVTITKRRVIRKKCKLSIAAIEFFEKYPEVKENLIINQKENT